MASPRTPSTTPTKAPDLLTSPIAAELLVAELHEHADRVERDAAEAGQSRIAEARVRIIRRHAAQVERVHAARDDIAEGDQ